jgi:hypothetical protein
MLTLSTHLRRTACAEASLLAQCTRTFDSPCYLALILMTRLQHTHKHTQKHTHTHTHTHVCILYTHPHARTHTLKHMHTPTHLLYRRRLTYAPSWTLGPSNGPGVKRVKDQENGAITYMHIILKPQTYERSPVYARQQMPFSCSPMTSLVK